MREELQRLIVQMRHSYYGTECQVAATKFFDLLISNKDARRELMLMLQQMDQPVWVNPLEGGDDAPTLSHGAVS